MVSVDDVVVMGGRVENWAPPSPPADQPPSNRKCVHSPVVAAADAASLRDEMRWCRTTALQRVLLSPELGL